MAHGLPLGVVEFFVNPSNEVLVEFVVGAVFLLMALRPVAWRALLVWLR